MKQIEVTIMGQSYVLACPEGGEEALLAAVATVDREMSAIRDAGRVRARERIAVLAALNVAYGQAERSGAAAPPLPPAVPGAAQADAEAGARIDSLIAKIDHALGSDGQLL